MEARNEASDADSIRGFMTFSEVAEQSGLPVSTILERLGLSLETSPSEQIGRALRIRDLDMSDLREALRTKPRSSTQCIGGAPPTTRSQRSEVMLAKLFCMKSKPHKRTCHKLAAAGTGLTTMRHTQAHPSARTQKSSSSASSEDSDSADWI